MPQHLLISARGTVFTRGGELVGRAQLPLPMEEDRDSLQYPNLYSPMHGCIYKNAGTFYLVCLLWLSK